MKIAILAALLVVAGLLSAILYSLFQPASGYQAQAPTPRTRQAAVGRAVLEAGRRDPAIAAMVRAAVMAAPEDDRALAADLIVGLPER